VPVNARQPSIGLRSGFGALLTVGLSSAAIAIELSCPWQQGHQWKASTYKNHGWNGSGLAWDFVRVSPDSVSDGAPVLAAADGTVVFSGFHKNRNGSPGYGYLVQLDHGDGYVTFYAHLREGTPAAKEARLRRGEQVGLCGNTGRSDGSHIHFELLRNGKGAKIDQLDGQSVSPGAVLTSHNTACPQPARPSLKPGCPADGGSYSVGKPIHCEWDWSANDIDGRFRGSLSHP